MFDVALRRLVDPALFRIARVLAAARFSANALTITGAAIGLGAAFFITQADYTAALLCIVLNRLFDGLDGAIARINGPTDFGGYLDSLCDFLFYVSIPVAFGIISADNHMPALALVASFTLTAVSFLGYAAIAARRNNDDGALPADGRHMHLYRALGFIIQCAGGFIKNQDARVAEQRAGNGDALTLSA